MDLMTRIKEYYEIRGLKVPTVEEALMFVHTELAEVYELLIARSGGWTRNNPQNKPVFTKEGLGEELGDAIMMLMVAGWVEGVDPVKALLEKLYRKKEK